MHNHVYTTYTVKKRVVLTEIHMFNVKNITPRILGMSWGVKNTFFEAPGVSLGGSGVCIGGVKILRAEKIHFDLGD